MSMKGSNELHLSPATMDEIVQQWLDRAFTAAAGKHDVMEVRQVNTPHKEFVVRLEQREDANG